MVDRKHRDLLADAIHELIIGRISNDEFASRVIGEYGMNPLKSPDRWQDAAIGPMVERAWCLYSDDNEYRLSGAYSLTREVRAEVLRWILFLRSDSEYEWPPIRFINPFFASASISGCLLSLLTLGMWGRAEAKRSFEEWIKSGEFSVWPFHSLSEFEQAYSEFCPLRRVQAA